MASEPILAVLDLAAVHRRYSGSSILSDYWSLTKPEVNFLIAITAVAAFCLGSPAHFFQFPWFLLANTMIGTVLVASGAATLNQVMERRFDEQMRRTARRPIAAGRIEPIRALVFGILLSFAGVVHLALAARPAAALLALVTLGGYLFLYTPLKRRTPLCTLAGAFPGAMPVLIGFIAATGRLTREAWQLYAIVFLWQFPHFMAIAWMYREDYARAGYRILPRAESRNYFVTCQSFVASLGLIPLGLISVGTGKLAVGHCAAILVVGIFFSYFAARFTFRRSSTTARQLLLASIIYLPVVLILIMLNKG